MKFISDLHIHSKYSRATAKNLDLENIWLAAQLKGIGVVGTGDFTHPAWIAEIAEKLEPAEPGLFKLKEDIARSYEDKVPQSCRGTVRFILVSEISNIYKKNGQTRKNHNLIFAPSLEVVHQINHRLDAIGNIHSDGRPILGLDARNLLEIILEVSPDTFLIPAHIWTPWFSVLGSKSGFDSIEECFEDLSEHIFAIETGLSSDPDMNWRVSSLDRYSLVSNSDAHSPSKLGREANIFDTELSYFHIRSALENHDPEKFLGTFEFYPEEGKYHVDGHRKCNVCLQPSETIALDKTCPVCGKALTVGVLFRVEQLADRSKSQKPQHAGAYYHLIPLEHILSEVLKVGPTSKKVQNHYQRLIRQLGPEFDILHRFPIPQIKEVGVPLLEEAIRRMRENQVHFAPGYDGEYGKVTIFSAEERQELLSQKSLFQMPEAAPPKKLKFTAKRVAPKSRPKSKASENKPTGTGQGEPILPATVVENEDQRRAIEHADGPLLIVAGPGTGKTFTLTQRIFYLMDRRKIRPDQILAVTFTRKAATEMQHRIAGFRGQKQGHRLPLITTFHGLCWRLIQEGLSEEKRLGIIDPDDQLLILKDALTALRQQGTALSLTEKDYLDKIVKAKQAGLLPHEILLKSDSNDSADDGKELAAVYQTYQKILMLHHLLDFEDVVGNIVRRLEDDPSFRKACQKRFTYIFVDEYQDLNEGQYRIISALAPDPQSQICVIGDPDQAIYGFRGSDLAYFERFKVDFPKAQVIHLGRNYRSTETILESSFQVIQKGRADIDKQAGRRTYSGINGDTRTISIMSSPSEKAEAVAIGRVIEQMMGGLGFHAIDFDKLTHYQDKDQCGFSDFAVLFRTHSQGKIIKEVLEAAGIPCQLASRENIYQTPGIRQLLKFLNLVDGHGTFIDFELISRCFNPGVPRAVISAFKAWAYENQLPLSKAMRRLEQISIPNLNKAGQGKLVSFWNALQTWEHRLTGLPVAKKMEILANEPFIQKLIINHRDFEEILKKLVDRSMAFELETTEFLTSLALDNDTDQYETGVEKVALMTMHAAKGLEFPIVFIAGCEEGLIPFKQGKRGDSDPAEERRLFYVAMTRAKEMLFFSWAAKRRHFGEVLPKQMSPFVMDIERCLQEYVPVEAKKKSRTSRQTQLNLF